MFYLHYVRSCSRKVLLDSLKEMVCRCSGYFHMLLFSFQHLNNIKRYVHKLQDNMLLISLVWQCGAWHMIYIEAFFSLYTQAIVCFTNIKFQVWKYFGGKIHWFSSAIFRGQNMKKVQFWLRMLLFPKYLFLAVSQTIFLQSSTCQ